MKISKEEINNRIDYFINNYINENEDGLTKKEIFLKTVFETMAVYEDGHNEIEILNFNSEGFNIRLDGYDFIGENEIHFYISELRDKDEYITREKMMVEINKVIKFINFSISQFDKILKKDDPLYNISNYIRNSFNDEVTYKIYFITNADVICEKNFNTKFIQGTETRKVEILAYDIEDIHELGVFNSVEQKRVDVNFKETFNTYPKIVKSPIQCSEFQSYLIFVKGIILAKTYAEHGYQFLNGNVRAYLKKTQKVNKGIYETIKNNPELFVAYNNGISSVAQDLIFDEDGNLLEIKGWQIVNGGQTTATLYEALKDNIDLSKVVVPVKICELSKSVNNNEEMIANISEYANTQSKVAKSDFSSNEKYHVDMEKYSKTISTTSELSTLNMEKWFYERTKGQYELTKSRDINGNFSIEFPKNMKFDKTELAKAVMSWEQEPYTVSLGKENNFQQFNNKVKSNKIENEVTEKYYKKVVALVILFRAINKIVNEVGFGGYKANITTYTMSLISFLTDKELDLNKIWKEQDIDDNLKRIISSLCKSVDEKIKETPSNNTNVQMWCRKKECWDNVKQIEVNNINEIYKLCKNKEKDTTTKQYIKIKNKTLSIEQINLTTLNKLIDFGLEKEFISQSELKIFQIIINNIRNHAKLTDGQLEYISKLITSCIESGFRINGDD